MIACICGGVIEAIIFGIMCAVSAIPLISTWIYNRGQMKKCKCACHPKHKEC